MPSPSIPVCIKPCRDRCYKPPYMFLIYIFSCLFDSRFENLHINCIIFQLMKVRIESIELTLQRPSIHAQQNFRSGLQGDQSTTQIPCFSSTLRLFLQYISGHYPAGMADLVELLGAHPQEPIYMIWQYTNSSHFLYLVK